MNTRYGSALSATVAGVLERFKPQRPVGRLEPDDRIDGLRCLVTGANSGLGLAIARALARRGGRVVMAGRTQDARARATVAAAASEGNASVEELQLDLADLASVDGFCDAVAARGVRFDRVVLNAGVVPRAARRTGDGFEEGFQVNYLANVALLRRLLGDGVIPNRTFAEDAGPRATRPRIVFVSSEAHRSARPPDWATLGRFAPYGVSAAVRQYGLNKLLLSTFAAELDRRLQRPAADEGEVPVPVDVAVHQLCPGAVNTRIAREAPLWSQPLLKVVLAATFAPPARAAEPVEYLCCARSVEGQSGLYLHRMAAKTLAPAAGDRQNGRELWAASERLLAEGPP